MLDLLKSALIEVEDTRFCEVATGYSSRLIALSDFPADSQFCQAIADIKFDP